MVFPASWWMVLSALVMWSRITNSSRLSNKMGFKNRLISLEATLDLIRSATMRRSSTDQVVRSNPKASCPQISTLPTKWARVSCRNWGNFPLYSWVLAMC